MIDYEKLKLIHELTNKIDEIDEVAVQHPEWYFKCKKCGEFYR